MANAFYEGQKSFSFFLGGGLPPCSRKPDELNSLSLEEYEHIEFERHFLREEDEITEKDLTRNDGGRSRT